MSYHYDNGGFCQNLRGVSIGSYGGANRAAFLLPAAPQELIHRAAEDLGERDEARGLRPDRAAFPFRDGGALDAETLRQLRLCPVPLFPVHSNRVHNSPLENRT